MWLSLKNYLCHLLSRPLAWRPLLAVYYLTYACPFRCPFCSDGAGTPYPALRSPVLDAPRILELLRRVRAHCDYLVLTGGEPTTHPAFGELLQGLGAVGFDGVVLTTRGPGLEPHLAAVDAAVRYLVFSLDTLDPAKGDRWLGAAPGTHARGLAAIEAAARRPGRRYEILISSVATPDNLADLHDVYRYARDRGYRFAVCPQLVGVKAHAVLAGNPEYRRLFNHLIAEKRAGRAINGSPLYLEYLRDLRKFTCRPSTVLAIAPTGDVFYPCLELGSVAGNLLDTPDLHAIRAAGRRRFGPEPSCDNRCHSACALGFALILNHPLRGIGFQVPGFRF